MALWSVSAGRASAWVLPLLAMLACGAGYSDAPSLGPAATLVRWMVPGLLVGNILIASIVSPGVGLPLYAAIIPIIGWLRREMIPLVGYSGNDPITLIPAAVAVILVVRLALQRRIRIDTIVAKVIFPLFLVMAVQVFNPTQGGLIVGVAGAFFYFIPMMFYFVGKEHLDLRIAGKVLTVILSVSVAAAAYGAYQGFFGFNDREWAWVEQARYNQKLFGIYRVFSTFLSFGEFTTFLTMGALVAWTRVLGRRFLNVVPFVFLSGTIFLSSSRTSVILLLFAAVAAWSVLGRNRRTWVIRGTIAGVIAVIGLFNLLSGVDTQGVVDRNQMLINYQSSGLTDPFGDQSTGRFHRDLALFGLRSGFVRPAGYGLGATTIASQKFGEQDDVHTELDFTNFMVSTGLVGGVLYAVLAVVLLRRMLFVWITTRSPAALGIFGVAMAALGNWTTGGYYAPSTLMWLLLGVVDAEARRLEREAEKAAQPSPSKDNPTLAPVGAG